MNNPNTLFLRSELSGSLDAQRYLDDLNVRLAAMEAGFSVQECFEEQVRAVTGLASAVHTQEVVQEREKLWKSIASVVQMGEPFSIQCWAVSSGDVDTVWKFHDFSKPLIAETGAVRHHDYASEDDVPADLEMQARPLVNDAGTGIAQAVKYAQEKPVFSARKVPEPILGVAAERIGRNKFRFEPTALRMRAGGTVLAHTATIDATLYSAYNYHTNAGIQHSKECVHRHGAFGIDDTSAWLQLQPHDASSDPEDIFASICDEIQDAGATSPEASYSYLHDTYIKREKASLDGMRLVKDWLQRPLVAPVTAASLLAPTSR